MPGQRGRVGGAVQYHGGDNGCGGGGCRGSEGPIMAQAINHI